MSDRNLVTWATIISGYDQVGKPLLAVELCSQFRLQPNEFVFSSSISACASLWALRTGEQIHACSVDDFTYSSALTACAGIASLPQSKQNNIITGFANHGLGKKSLELFGQMIDGGTKPDSVTFIGLLTTCDNQDFWIRGQPVSVL
ncbi:hypothetical protein POM88_034928 [Heracleum sosnowskyi]|uniref:Pentatricopeptide repeat-containing protein n=1 Tax=Heracleum sosnowskyi TaxID=360622 RepID=A0AAD8HKG5_9APIA|nr:hypothetical protein POM88_034921 [Heracleum sosnowskyi]KAK1368836.1 hypothetical protein POM88_034928 [Heracleum sosnowskyi]